MGRGKQLVSGEMPHGSGVSACAGASSGFYSRHNHEMYSWNAQWLATFDYGKGNVTLSITHIAWFMLDPAG